jgi:1-acyl-sn-glycerol-3-phosphate acyltransferase
MGKIENWSVRYAMVFQWVNLFHWLAYKDIQVFGLENIPKDKPVIFAPNHQNALMDAMVIVCTAPGQTVFLARADIFKSKLASVFLRFLKIMPVYRIRDGKDSLDKNDEIFETSINILIKKKRLCLFPEAAHIGMRSMLPHKKAIPRIAFLAGEKTNFELDLQVVPVGISYSHYYRYRRNLVVYYGKPIDVKEYFKLYNTEGERQATIKLRDRIYDELDKLIINVRNKKDYELYEQSFTIFRKVVMLKLGLKDSPSNYLKADRYLNMKLHDHLDGASADRDLIVEKLQEYNRLKATLNLDEKTLQCGRMTFKEGLLRFSLLLVMLPVAIYGALVNGWLFWLTRYPYRKNIKDPQFWSSLSFGFSLFAYSIWYIILFVVFGFVIHNWWIALLLSVLAIPAGIVAWETGQLIVKTRKCFRLNAIIKGGNPTFKLLLMARKQLFDFYYNVTRD